MFPRGIYLHPSAIVDYKFFVINSVFLSYVKLSAAVYSVVGLFGIADGVHGLLSATFGARPSSGEPSLSALIAYTVVMMVTADFAKFFAHYLQHKIPILWEFHKVHHSAEVLTPITVNRVHPVDVVVDQVLAAIMGGLVVGTFSYFYTAKGWVEITLANISVAYFVFFLVANLRHSHIPVRFGWRTSHFFCSPYMHQIHHSSERRHWDKNFSIIVSVWDGLFGTLYVPREEEAFRLGLSGEENHRFSSVLALYAAPFAGVMRRLLIRSTPSAKIE